MSRKILLFVLVLASLVLGFAFGYRRAVVTDAKARQPLYYVDSMHPTYRSNKPGIAPDCGMELTPVYLEDLEAGSPLALPERPGALQISAAAQRIYGIGLTKVHSASGQEMLRMFGRVAADETRVYRINFGTDGYVKETHEDAVGSRVVKNQRLATVYSPEFLSVAGGYLSANERAQGASGGGMKENSAPTPNAASAQARADRLRNLGMSDSQIEEMSATRKIPEDVYLVSPTNGFIWLATSLLVSASSATRISTASPISVMSGSSRRSRGRTLRQSVQVRLRASPFRIQAKSSRLGSATCSRRSILKVTS